MAYRGHPGPEPERAADLGKRDVGACERQHDDECVRSHSTWYARADGQRDGGGVQSRRERLTATLTATGVEQLGTARNPASRF